MFTEDVFIGALERASWHMDQPISHPNSLGIWLLAEQSRERVTVLLSGEGADEVFGGYRASHATHSRRARSRHSSGPRNSSRRRSSRSLRPARPAAGDRAARGAVSRGPRRPPVELPEVRDADLSGRPAGRQDKMTMAHGVENRVPFLDRRVSNFARALPAEHTSSDHDSDGRARHQERAQGAREPQLRRRVRLPPQIGIYFPAGPVLP